MKFDFLVYSDTNGTYRRLFVGTFAACLDYVAANPRGPFGGSTHIKGRAA